MHTLADDDGVVVHGTRVMGTGATVRTMVGTRVHCPGWCLALCTHCSGVCHCVPTVVVVVTVVTRVGGGCHCGYPCWLWLSLLSHCSGVGHCCPHCSGVGHCGYPCWWCRSLWLPVLVVLGHGLVTL